MKNKLLIYLAFVLPLLFFASPIKAAAPLDSDNDGLPDNLELLFKTDPHNPDSDGDGFKDGAEVDWGYNPLSTTTVKLPQRIEVDLKKQRLYYFVGNIKWKEFVVSSGKKSTPTPKGEFTIQGKSKKAWSRSAGLWMPYWMALGGGVGIHELPVWPNGYREGENHLGTPVSHGCVRLGIKEAPYLYDRIASGVKVKIF